jgi:hypothetical protein
MHSERLAPFPWSARTAVAALRNFGFKTMGTYEPARHWQAIRDCAGLRIIEPAFDAHHPRLRRITGHTEHGERRFWRCGASIRVAPECETPAA